MGSEEGNWDRIKGKVRSKMKIIISKDVEARNFIVQLLFSF